MSLPRLIATETNQDGTNPSACAEAACGPKLTNRPDWVFMNGETEVARYPAGEATSLPRNTLVHWVKCMPPEAITLHWPTVLAVELADLFLFGIVVFLLTRSTATGYAARRALKRIIERITGENNERIY